MMMVMMMKSNPVAVLAMAAVCVLAMAGAGEAKEVYPFPSFLRTFLSGDPLTERFCLEDGSPALQYGVNDQKYYAVQPCSVGQIGLWKVSDGTFHLGLGLIGGVAGAIQDLGTVANINNKYHVEYPYDGFFSLRFGERSQHFELGSPETPIAIPDADLAPLKTTSPTTSVAPTQSHVYLVRFSKTATTSTGWEETTFLAKIIVVDWKDATNAIVRWEILLGATEESSESDPAEQAKRIGTAKAIGVAGLLIALLALVISLGTVLYFRYSGPSQGFSVNKGGYGSAS